MARDWIDEQIDAAMARGKELAYTEPRARSTRHDRCTGRDRATLANERDFVFPARKLQFLADATDARLADIEVSATGYGLHWPALDANFTAPGLLAGLFGTRAWMGREPARAAGKTTSPAKAAAARLNGSKGGRPAGSRARKAAT